MLVLRCKLVLLGDATVGKTALVQQFVKKHFPKNYAMTVGSDFLVKQVPLKQHKDVVVELHIYDIAGQAAYLEMAPRYWENAGCSMLVYNVADADSLKACASWLESFQESNPGRTVPAVAVGNKIDLGERRAVPERDGQQFAEENHLAFFETSAANGDTVAEPFVKAANMFYERYQAFLQNMSEMTG